MASQMITLGIGTPSDIPHFILVGLTPTGPVEVVEAHGETIYVEAVDRTITVAMVDRTVEVDASDRTILVPERPTP